MPTRGRQIGTPPELSKEAKRVVYAYYITQKFKEFIRPNLYYWSYYANFANIAMLLPPIALLVLAICSRYHLVFELHVISHRLEPVIYSSVFLGVVSISVAMVIYSTKRRFFILMAVDIFLKISIVIFLIILYMVNKTYIVDGAEKTASLVKQLYKDYDKVPVAKLKNNGLGECIYVSDAYESIVDTIQIEMECCGYNDRHDFQNLTKFWKNKVYCYGSHIKMKVPPSCCMRQTTHSFTYDKIRRDCIERATPILTNGESCLYKVKNFMTTISAISLPCIVIYIIIILICIFIQTMIIIERYRKLDDVEVKRKRGSWDIYKKQINQKPQPINNHFVILDRILSNKGRNSYENEVECCRGNNRCQCIYDEPPDENWNGITNEYIHVSRNRPPMVGPFNNGLPEENPAIYISDTFKFGHSTGWRRAYNATGMFFAGLNKKNVKSKDTSNVKPDLDIDQLNDVTGIL